MWQLWLLSSLSYRIKVCGFLHSQCCLLSCCILCGSLNITNLNFIHRFLKLDRVCTETTPPAHEDLLKIKAAWREREELFLLSSLKKKKKKVSELLGFLWVLLVLPLQQFRLPLCLHCTWIIFLSTWIGILVPSCFTSAVFVRWKVCLWGGKYVCEWLKEKLEGYEERVSLISRLELQCSS